MNALEELYTTIEMLQKHGLAIDHKLQEELDHSEEELIKQEVLPLLRGAVAERLGRIRRDVVLVVEHHPGEPITVALSRKVRISDFIDAIRLTPVSQSVPSLAEEGRDNQPPAEPTRCVVNHTKGLKVTFPDGTVIWYPRAIDTYVAVLRRIGFERVAAVGLKHSGVPMVTREKLPIATIPKQHACDGWYIYSNLSNKAKVRDLTIISDRYKLGLRIEQIKPKREKEP